MDKKGQINGGNQHECSRKKIIIKILTVIEEHVSHGSRLFMDFEWMPGENEPLSNDAGCVCIVKGSHSHKRRC